MSSPETTAASHTREYLEAILGYARASGHDDLVRKLGLEQQLLISDEPATVVVAGERGVGKSALINSVLGRPGLLPTGSGGVTATSVIVTSGEREEAIVHTEREPDGTPHALSDIATFASTVGNPNNDRLVLFVQARIRSKLLQRIRIIDTPGIDGVASAAGRAVLGSLSRADALVFVADATVPLSGPEAEFLADAVSRIDRVLVCLTRADKATHLPQIMTTDRQLLLKVSPTLARASLVSASPLLDEKAYSLLRAGASDKADRLHAMSGTGLIAQWLGGEVGRGAAAVRVANAVMVGRDAIDALDAWHVKLKQSLSAEQDGTDSIVALQQRRQELGQSATRSRTWLHDEMAALERHQVNWLQHELSRLRNDAEVDLEQRWSAGRHETLPDELRPQLETLARHLEGTLHDELARITDEQEQQIGLSGLEPERLDLSRPEGERVRSRPPAPRDRRQVLSAVRQAMSYGRSSHSMMQAAAATALIPGAGWIVSGALSLVTLKLNMASLARADQQREASRLLREILDGWSRDMIVAIGDFVRDARRGADEQLSELIAAEGATLNAQIEQLTRTQRDENTQGRGAEIDRVRFELRRLREVGDQLAPSATDRVRAA